MTAYSDRFVRRLLDFSIENLGAYDFQEAVISAIFQEIVKADDIVVDAGAHAGRHTMTLARLVGKNGKVFAFEPLPSMAQQLREKFDGWCNVVVTPKALSSQAGRLKFFYVKDNPSYSGHRMSDKVDNRSTIEIAVDAVTLDDVWEDADACRLMKLDVEGAEFFALSGALKTMARSAPMVIFENDLGRTASQHGYTKEQFFDVFTRLEYRLFDIVGTQIDDWHWHGRRPHFDNYIAVKRQEDLCFVTHTLPEVVASRLLEMSDVSVALSKSVFTVMQWKANREKPILFGAGNRARLILEKFPMPFQCVVDNDSNKWGRTFCGMEVWPPRTLLDRNRDGNVKVAIVSLFADEIETQLLNMGIPADGILKFDVR